jgi:hypothetical protein
VGGVAGNPGEMVEHLKKVAGGAICHASAAIWWKKHVPLGNCVARWHGGMVAIWWEVGEMRRPIWGKMLVSPIGMARGVCGCSRHPSSPPSPVCWVSTGCVGQRKHPAPNENLVWGHG